ncbi:MFS transporter [Microbacterium hominis]|uniref:MFS transporter n=1 Tax=Microbacterium hominis TaxID=162426 RepID=UPI001964A464|nr:MFS transporter [Microbacterium hominis]QRY40725.1 MFS transporter [Microbacterium hominis]
MSSAAPAAGVDPARSRGLRMLLSGSFPNLVQWYNLYVFAAFAPFFRTEFFDPADGGSLVYVYGIFALTFVMRPVGSWLFGRIADRRGLRFALVSSVLLMSAGSAVLAVSPTASDAGAAAGGILLLVGLVQGVATGGEYGVSAVYLSEVSTDGRRGFFSSFQTATIVAGQVLAQATLLVLLTSVDRAEVSAWGWRVAFGIGALAGLSTLLVARRMPGERRRPTAGVTLTVLLREGWRPLLWVVLMTSGGTAAFYTFTVTVPAVSREAAYGSGGAAAERASTTAILLALIVLMVLQPVGGALSDRVGRKALLVFFGVAGVIVIGPVVAVAGGLLDPWVLFAALVVVFTVLTGYLATNTIVKAEAFPPQLRALGVGFGYAVANSLFGGTAPLIYHATAASSWVFSGYVTVLVGITLATALTMRGGRTSPLDRRL